MTPTTEAASGKREDGGGGGGPFPFGPLEANTGGGGGGGGGEEEGGSVPFRFRTSNLLGNSSEGSGKFHGCDGAKEDAAVTVVVQHSNSNSSNNDDDDNCVNETLPGILFRIDSPR